MDSPRPDSNRGEIYPAFINSDSSEDGIEEDLSIWESISGNPALDPVLFYRFTPRTPKWFNLGSKAGRKPKMTFIGRGSVN